MKLIFTAIAILAFLPGLMAQDTINTGQVQKPEQKSSPGDKLYYGGYVNFSLGSYTSIGVEPMVGYKIIPRLSLGAKIRYDYIKDNRYATSYSTSVYGGSLFTRLIVIRQVYLHAEFATYNYELFYTDGSSEREWIPFLFLGGGFHQPVGNRAALNVQVLFDVLNDEKSPYRTWEPFYSVGMSVGF